MQRIVIQYYMKNIESGIKLKQNPQKTFIMKSIKFILTFILVMTFSFIAKANNNPEENEIKTTITKTVQELLREPGFPLERDFSITLKFFVNEKHEIVVLSVVTDYNKKIVDDYIKTRLNYKKLTENIKSNMYIIPVKMVKEKTHA